MQETKCVVLAALQKEERALALTLETGRALGYAVILNNVDGRWWLCRFPVLPPQDELVSTMRTVPALAKFPPGLLPICAAFVGFARQNITRSPITWNTLGAAPGKDDRVLCALARGSTDALLLLLSGERIFQLPAAALVEEHVPVSAEETTIIYRRLRFDRLLQDGAGRIFVMEGVGEKAAELKLVRWNESWQFEAMYDTPWATLPHQLRKRGLGALRSLAICDDAYAIFADEQLQIAFSVAPVLWKCGSCGYSTSGPRCFKCGATPPPYVPFQGRWCVGVAKGNHLHLWSAEWDDVSGLEILCCNPTQAIVVRRNNKDERSLWRLSFPEVSSPAKTKSEIERWQGLAPIDASVDGATAGTEWVIWHSGGCWLPGGTINGLRLPPPLSE